MSSNNDLKNAIKQGAEGLGMDDDASSSIIAGLNDTIAPMVMVQDLTDEDLEADDHRGICFLVDASGSMSGIKDIVVDSFNDIIIPALLEGAKDEIGSIHISGFAFSNSVYPLWGGGWNSLAESPPKLEMSEYWASQAGGGTALHEAGQMGITSCLSYTGKILNEKGLNPQTVIAVLSDGMNNCPPQDASVIESMAKGLDPELVTLPFLGFPTYGSDEDLEDAAKAMGWRDVLISTPKSGQSDEERRREFRHLMGVFSSSLVGRVSGSMVAQPQSNGSTTFWQST